MLTHKWIDGLFSDKYTAYGMKLPNNLLKIIQSAVQFDVGDLRGFPKMKPGSFNEANMPYPITLIQMQISNDSHVLALHISESVKNHAVGWLRLDESKGDIMIWVVVKKGHKPSCGDICFYKQVGDGSFIYRLGNGQVDEQDSGQLDEQCRSVLDFSLQSMFVLSCSNVETVDNAPSKMLNKMRAKQGKPLINSHKTLVIKSENTASNTNNGGTHASPRVHLRRGHIRRLPTKNVWVQPCVVGDKSKGIVTKDYKWQSGELQ